MATNDNKKSAEDPIDDTARRQLELFDILLTNGCAADALEVFWKIDVSLDVRHNLLKSLASTNNADKPVMREVVRRIALDLIDYWTADKKSKSVNTAVVDNTPAWLVEDNRRLAADRSAFEADMNAYRQRTAAAATDKTSYNGPDFVKYGNKWIVYADGKFVGGDADRIKACQLTQSNVCYSVQLSADGMPVPNESDKPTAATKN